MLRVYVAYLRGVSTTGLVGAFKFCCVVEIGDSCFKCKSQYAPCSTIVVPSWTLVLLLFQLGAEVLELTPAAANESPM